MSTLYALTADYLKLMELGDSDDPEDQQAFLDTLEGLTGEIEIKADDYATVISEFNAQTAKVKTEIDRLTRMKRALENSVKTMKDRLKNAMEVMNTTEIKTDLHSFKIVKNGGKQAMTITGEVPDNYTKIVYETDNDKIRADLEAGKELSFAHLEPRGTNLRIK